MGSENLVANICIMIIEYIFERDQLDWRVKYEASGLDMAHESSLSGPHDNLAFIKPFFQKCHVC